MLIDSRTRYHVSLFTHPTLPFTLLALLLIFGAWLRISTHNWDGGQHFYPDEATVTESTLNYANLPPGAGIGDLFDPQHSPLNPRTGGRQHHYGTLPVYLTKISSVAAYALSGNSYLLTFDGLQQMGRVMSGLADTLSILLVFAIGRLLWGMWLGVMSATLYAFAVLPIQLSHFYIAETFMTMFMTATLLFSLLYFGKGIRDDKGERARSEGSNPSSPVPYPLSFSEGKMWPLALAGACAGMAMACKLSAAPALLLPLTAVALREAKTRQWRRITGLLLIVGVAAFFGLFMGDPFAVLDAPTYLAQVIQQADIQRGAIDVWFTRRYVGTWPVLYPLGQLLMLGAGPLTGLAGLTGAFAIGVRARRGHQHQAGWLLLLGAGSYFLSVAFLEAKWVRYLAPLAPYLCLFATALAFTLWEIRPQRQPGAVMKRAVPALLIVGALLGGLAYNAVYGAEHTRVRASRWIYSNVQVGSKIGVELNNTALPVSLLGDGAPDKDYTLVPFRLLGDVASEDVAAMLRTNLAQADYLVSGSTWASGTAPRLPWRYPVQARYFEALWSGRLGLEPVFTATSYPTIFGLQIPDDGDLIDDSFTEYDHPTVRIYRKVRTLTDAEWSSIFADVAQQPSIFSRYPPR